MIRLTLNQLADKFRANPQLVATKTSREWSDFSKLSESSVRAARWMADAGHFKQRNLEEKKSGDLKVHRDKFCKREHGRCMVPSAALRAANLQHCSRLRFSASPGVITLTGEKENI